MNMWTESLSEGMGSILFKTLQNKYEIELIYIFKLIHFFWDVVS